MFMATKTLHTRHSGFLLLASLVTNMAFASPTVEQVRQVMEKRGAPQWQKSIAQIKAFRANPPDADIAEKWRQLDSETDPSTGKAPLARITSPRDARDFQDMTMWLRWRILSENADGRYSYAYAGNLHYMMKPDGTPLYPVESVVFFFHARLALAIDGARCADPSGPESVAFGFESQPYFRPLIERIDKMSRKERAIAILEAVTLEELRGERQPFAALCTQGTKTMLRAMTEGRQPVEMPSKGSGSMNGLGNTYAVDVSGIEPEMITEDQWRAKRKQILDQQVRNAAEAL
jgi:hypothetical protein